MSVTYKQCKIFLSYGHDANTPLVLKIKTDLELRGHFVWIDVSKINAGDEWRKKIVEGLIDTTTVLSFLSVHSVRKPGVCLDELKIALGLRHGNIKTVLLEKENMVTPPATLSDVQWLDLSDWKEYGDIGSAKFNLWYTPRFDILCSLIESDEAATFVGEIDKLKEILTPYLSDSKEQYLLNKEYSGRKWLDIELDEWKKDKTSKAFILLGTPGIGKSTFAVHAMHFDYQVACCLFCEWDKSRSTDPKSVIRTIAFKLATKVSDYRAILLHKISQESFTTETATFSASELFDYLLTDLLLLLVDGQREDAFIIIDGLDETLDNEGLYLVETLTQNIRKTPSWIRFIITSRPESNIANLFDLYCPKIMSPNDENNEQDIRQYLVYSLQPYLIDKTKRLQIISSICENCEGSFLYAALFVDEIKRDACFLENINTYPRGLDSFYHISFKRKFKDEKQYSEIRMILEYLLALQNLPTVIIDGYLDINGYVYSNFINLLNSFIITTNCSSNKSRKKLEGITLCHKSLIDWLRDPLRSGDYYIDINNGARQLAEKFKNKLSDIDKTILYSAPYDQELLPYKFMQENITRLYVLSKQWSGLKEFLLDASTPLNPYWDAVLAFPKLINISELACRFFNDAQNIEYLKVKQSEGNIGVIILIVELVIKQYGISNLPIDMFNIYTDAIHLSGDYKKAVDMDRHYLQSYSIDEMQSNKQLLHIYTRMLHHSKFFCSINLLQKEIGKITECVKNSNFFDEYCELLIMNGNIGTLCGDIQLSKNCSIEVISVAKKHNLTNYELRGARKYSDILILKKEYNKAIEFLHNYIDVDITDNLSRYELYLFGSLGNAYKGIGNFDQSLKCFNVLKNISLQRGIQGWYAHSNLGIASLMSANGFYGEAENYLSDALKVYQKIEQEWGRINCNIIRLDIEIRKCGLIKSVDMLQQTENSIKRLGYNMYLEAIDKLKSNKKLVDFSLLFI